MSICAMREEIFWILQMKYTIKKENTLHISKLLLLLTFIVFSSELIDTWVSLLDFSKKLAPI